MGLYIPIWFYFNAEKKSIQDYKNYFTFQYGSTLISSPFRTLDSSSCFTFKYGSTLIFYMMFIYEMVHFFTFQYGSTLIRLISIFDFLIYSDIYFVYLKTFRLYNLFLSTKKHYLLPVSIVSAIFVYVY